MPLINVKLIDGVFSPTQKKQIAQKLTEAMVSIEGEALRSVTCIGRGQACIAALS